MDYKELVNYLEYSMKMQHIYQPVMIRTLLESKNTATVEAIARAKDAMEIPPPSIDADAKITKNILDLLGDARCILVTDKAKPYGIITKIDAIRSLMK